MSIKIKNCKGGEEDEEGRGDFKSWSCFCQRLPGWCNADEGRKLMRRGGVEREAGRNYPQYAANGIFCVTLFALLCI